jgi:hypothetical protein
MYRSQDVYFGLQGALAAVQFVIAGRSLYFGFWDGNHWRLLLAAFCLFAGFHAVAQMIRVIREVA